MKRENEDFTIAAEYQALNLCIHTSTSEFLKDYFPHEEARAIFEAIQTLKDRQEVITESSLLREANSINDNVDSVLVHTIYTFSTDSSSTKSVLDVLKDASTKYNVNKFAAKIVSLTNLPDKIDPQEISNLLYEAQDTLVNGQKKAISKTLEQCFGEYEEELDERATGHHYSFADPFMDDLLIRKAAPGQVVLLVGATGTGKSALSLNLINGMINTGIPSMYFSLEMDTISTMDRLISMRTGIPVEEWYKPESIGALKRKLENEKAILKEKPFRFIDDASLGLDQIQSLIREFKLTYKTDYVCVYLDLVTQIKDFTNLKGAGTLANTIEFAVNRLNAMAKAEGVCFVCVAQLNRETDSFKINNIDDIEQYRPTLTQIKNSNALGERARTVISVFRPKYYAERQFPNDDKVTLMEDVLEIQVLKQNQGQVGSVRKYLFDGPCFTLKPFVESDELDGIHF